MRLAGHAAGKRDKKIPAGIAKNKRMYSIKVDIRGIVDLLRCGVDSSGKR
jgi:hypothetical protein